MLYNKGNHAKFKCVQPQPSPLQDENGGKIHQTWNFGYSIFMEKVNLLYYDKIFQKISKYVRQ